MADQVLGDWKDHFTFMMATSDDASEIAQHVRDNFLRGEAMNIYLGWREDHALDHDEMVKIALSHNISFLVRDKRTGELAGIQLIVDKRLDGFDKLLKITSPNLHKILGFITKLEEQTEQAFVKYAKCDFNAEIFISSVATKYRGHGLAKEMYRRTIPFLREKGFPALRSTFTSPVTRAIGAKFGFVELGRLYFKDEKDENGEKVFPGSGDGEDEYASEIALIL